MNHIDPILSVLKSIDTLRQISSVISWDQETMMPEGGIEPRADQLAMVSGLIHDEWQSIQLKHELSKLMDLNSGEINRNLGSEESAFLRELYPKWKRNTKLPKDLVQNIAKTTSKSQHIWQKARKSNDFALFSPYLKELIELSREKIDILGFNDHPYNTLIEEFEPGMTVRLIDPIFNDLTLATKDYLSHYSVKSPPKINGPFDRERQLIYSKELMSLMGYDTNRGRLDESTHPFTIDIHPNDVRITTRINTDYLFESMSSTIHEVGHALYEQGLDPKWAYTPYGMSRSMGIHESQSRFWEIFIGQSLPFWEGQLPRIQALFPSTKHHVADDFYKSAKYIQPHWCRVESDVVTYNMHIILRYECEKRLFSEELDVDDIPRFWNEKMLDYLGIDVASDTQGCLQDVHWSAGLFGYFPSYTLGTLIAAQLYQKIRTTFSDLDEMIYRGEFIEIKKWLNEHVHFHGSKKTTSELMQDLSISYDPIDFLKSI